MPGQGRPSEGTGARALGCAICHETSAGTPRHVPDRLRSSFPLPAPSCPEGSNGTDSKPWVQILPPPLQSRVIYIKWASHKHYVGPGSCHPVLMPQPPPSAWAAVGGEWPLLISPGRKQGAGHSDREA